MSHDERSGSGSASEGAAVAEPRRIFWLLRAYGLLSLVSGLLILVVAGLIAFALATHADELLARSHDMTLTLQLSVVHVLVYVVTAAVAVVFGISLLRNHRRNAARYVYGLIALDVVSLVLEVMLRGAVQDALGSIGHIVFLLVVAVTVDPTLIEERRRERAEQEAEDEAAARAGTLGRAKGDRGFIELDFFNLFWVFVVCCVLGLVIETVYHMVVVDPGVYQDRAGMLFGPFSPIYGVGAVLMTVALNRFWRASPVVVFLVAAVFGGLFEAAVSWFMQVGFGAVAWDYSGFTIFGLFPDPIAELMGGRTSTLFMCMWGALGLFWIRVCLPRLLKLINVIPWRMRYSLTSVCAALMLVNAIMTFQSLECWYQRESGLAPSSPVEEFYAEHFDDAYMEHRFQSMTITPEDSARISES